MFLTDVALTEVEPWFHNFHSPMELRRQMAVVDRASITKMLELQETGEGAQVLIAFPRKGLTLEPR